MPDVATAVAEAPDSPGAASCCASASRTPTQRVRADKSVTPTFLFAVLLWPAILRAAGAPHGPLPDDPQLLLTALRRGARPAAAADHDPEALRPADARPDHAAAALRAPLRPARAAPARAPEVPRRLRPAAAARGGGRGRSGTRRVVDAAAGAARGGAHRRGRRTGPPRRARRRAAGVAVRAVAASVRPRPDPPGLRDAMPLGWRARLRGARQQPRRPARCRSSGRSTRSADCRGHALVLRSSLYRSRPFGPGRAAGFRQRGGRAADRARAGDAARRAASARSAPRPRAAGRALGPATHRPRPAGARHATRSPAGDLQLPHPGIAERAFVLVPLAEIAPDLEVPGAGPRARRCSAAWTPPGSSASRHEQRSAGQAEESSRPRTASSWSRGRSASARPASRGGWPGASAASWCSSRATRTRSSSASTATRGRRPSRPSCTSCSSARGRCRSCARPTCSSACASSDYLLDKDRLFARLTLDDEEFALYEQVYARLAIDAPVPDLVVYLQAPVDVLLERIARRGIPYEQLIERRYLERLVESYCALLPRVRRGAGADRQRRRDRPRWAATPITQACWPRWSARAARGGTTSTR